MIDLEELASLTGIAPESATPLASRCAIALERRHRPGVVLTGNASGREISEALSWRERRSGEAHEDWSRVTEEGAEALALALAAVRHSWRVKRRLQARLAEGADWLLIDERGSSVILEIGGTDEHDLQGLLEQKIAQVKRSPFVSRSRAAACVVRFREPRAELWSGDEPR